jgi:hypothetical protein
MVQQHLRRRRKVGRQAQIVDEQHVALDARGLQRRVADRACGHRRRRKRGRDARLFAALLLARARA